jgi:hypothetical protein
LAIFSSFEILTSATASFAVADENVAGSNACGVREDQTEREACGYARFLEGEFGESEIALLGVADLPSSGRSLRMDNAGEFH